MPPGKDISTVSQTDRKTERWQTDKKKDRHLNRELKEITEVESLHTTMKNEIGDII